MAFQKCMSRPQEIHNYLKTVCADLHVTKGDFDEDASYPEDKVCPGSVSSRIATLVQFSMGCTGADNW